MDLSKLFETLQETLGGTLPGVLGALGILILGWLVAMAVRAGIRKGLGMLQVNQRLHSTTGSEAWWMNMMTRFITPLASNVSLKKV